MGENSKAATGGTLLRYGLPVVVAMLVLAPRTPAPPDPPHLDERDDDRRPTEIMVTQVPPAFEPDQAPVVP